MTEGMAREVVKRHDIDVEERDGTYPPLPRGVQRGLSRDRSIVLPDSRSPAVVACDHQ